MKPDSIRAGPPLAGADLECHLGFGDLSLGFVASVVDSLFAQGFSLRFPILLYERDQAERPMEQTWEGSQGFLNSLDRFEKIHSLVFRLTGNLQDLPVDLCLTASMKTGVLTLSVPEDMLWGYEPESGSAQIHRLRAFVAVCKEVTRTRRPDLIFIGTETYHAEDFASTGVRGTSIEHFDDAVFSEARVHELFEWYTRSYRERWNQTS